jgi:hypothetical protein
MTTLTGAFLQLFIATQARKKIIHGSTSFVSVKIQYDIWGIGTNGDKGIPSTTLIPGGNFYVTKILRLCMSVLSVT